MYTHTSTYATQPPLRIHTRYVKVNMRRALKLIPKHLFCIKIKVMQSQLNRTSLSKALSVIKWKQRIINEQSAWVSEAILTVCVCVGVLDPFQCLFSASCRQLMTALCLALLEVYEREVCSALLFSQTALLTWRQQSKTDVLFSPKDPKLKIQKQIASAGNAINFEKASGNQALWILICAIDHDVKLPA